MGGKSNRPRRQFLGWISGEKARPQCGQTQRFGSHAYLGGTAWRPRWKIVERGVGEKCVSQWKNGVSPPSGRLKLSHQRAAMEDTMHGDVRLQGRGLHSAERGGWVWQSWRAWAFHSGRHRSASSLSREWGHFMQPWEHTGASFGSPKVSPWPRRVALEVLLSSHQLEPR